MAGNNSIQFLRGTSTARASHSETSLVGQPIYEIDTNRLYVGNGTTAINNLEAIKASAADEATKATQDSNGNDIVDTYATKAIATQSINGLMSSADKVKLDSIPTNYWDAVEQGWITPLIGETKTIKIDDYECKIRCIGLNHDDLVSGGKARTTWQVINLFSFDFSASRWQMNSTNTNAGGWKECELRNKLNTDIFPTITDEEGNNLSNRIKQVIKRTANGGSQNGTEIVATNDYLFLPSVVELFGTTYTNFDTSNLYAHPGEGTQYELYSEAPIPEPLTGTGQFIPLKENSNKGTFYTSDNSTAKDWTNNSGDTITTIANYKYNYRIYYLDYPYSYWLRSPWLKGTNAFCICRENGIFSAIVANDVNVVFPCFCI